jgi:hypothetical protein
MSKKEYGEQRLVAAIDGITEVAPKVLGLLNCSRRIV